MRSKTLLLTIVSFCLLGVGRVEGADPPVAAGPAETPTTAPAVDKAQLRACLKGLAASAAELHSAGFRGEAKALADLVREMTVTVAGGGRIQPQHLAEVSKQQQQLIKLADMWRSGGSQERVAVLTRHAGALAKAQEYLQTVTAAAAPAPGAGEASTAIPTLTVTLRMGTPEAGDDDSSKRRPSGTSGTKVLIVRLKELERMFSSVSSLAGYVKSRKDDLKTTSIIFDVASDIAWHDVKAVVGTFKSFSGETRFSDLELRPPPAEEAAPDAGEKSSGARPMSPLVPERLGRPAAAAALADMTAGLKRVLFVLDVSAETYPTVGKMVLAQLAEFGEGAKVAVVALDAKRRPVVLVDWQSTAPLGRKLAAEAMDAHLAPRGEGNFVAMARRALDEPVACDAIVVVTEGPRVPVKSNTFSVVAALARHSVPVNLLVIGETDPTVATAIRSATAGRGRRAVFLPAEPFHTVAARH